MKKLQQNLHDVTKAVLWWKFIALNNGIKKNEEMSKVNIIKEYFRFSLRENS